MYKITTVLVATLFILMAGSLFAGDPVVVDQTGMDFNSYWYVGTYGQQIAVDSEGDVHIVYTKTWSTAVDTGYQIMYANVTDGLKLEVPDQEEADISPGIAFIDGGVNTPIYIYYGVNGRYYNYGPSMHLQSMAKVSTAGDAIEPLGIQSDKNYYHNPWYANVFSMQVDKENGLAHCLLSNPGGDALAYWQFDGTNFSEIRQMYFKDELNGVPGTVVAGKFRRNATKGADLAISKTGMNIAVAGLHPACNIIINIGSLAGNVWADDFESGLADGSMMALYDTTGSADGTNIPNNDPKPYTELQIVYDDDDNLHVVYDATYQDLYQDTTSNVPWDTWYSTYYSIAAGDSNAVYYGDGSHPKPQLLYWNSLQKTIKKLAESEYPMGNNLQWFSYADYDSGFGCWGKWGNDAPIANIKLILNSFPQEGEPLLVCVWEEMQGEVEVLVDTNWSLGNYSYYAYNTDLKGAVLPSIVQSWSAPQNITNTPDLDESELSVYKNILNGNMHMTYLRDTFKGTDRNNTYNDAMEHYYVNDGAGYTGANTFSIPIRKEGSPQVDVIYQEMPVSVITDIAPLNGVVPDKFNLSQNYPNPFNPTTSIKYSVPSGQVTMEIYNILGEKVVTLIDQEMTAGSYEINWNGKNNSGFKVASGIYFYQLQSDYGVKTKKMLLQK